MGNKIRSVRGSYDYFFVKPSENGNAHKTARKLISLRRVREVAITEGDCGFVVKAEQVYEEEDLLKKEIADAIGCSSKKAACYCLYVKS
ncbi:MAG: hypothetical protein KGH64_05360 [Candidatus Micrarchaeota archaeon]|nr:hypothetical protein [Candidatus Micrarchaeota archaeon]